jgi:hypothetical protein
VAHVECQHHSGFSVKVERLEEGARDMEKRLTLVERALGRAAWMAAGIALVLGPTAAMVGWMVRNAQTIAAVGAAVHGAPHP